MVYRRGVHTEGPEFGGIGFPTPTLHDALSAGCVGVYLNDNHLAAWRMDRDGNPVGRCLEITFDLKGMPASRRDGHLREAISTLLRFAQDNGARALAIENLDFKRDKAESREKRDHRKSFRHLVHGFPVAQFRARLVAMAKKLGITVVAVDPAYSSKWGASYWQKPLVTRKHPASRYEVAAVVIGRRALGVSARRRSEKNPSTAAHDGGESHRPYRPKRS